MGRCTDYKGKRTAKWYWQFEETSFLSMHFFTCLSSVSLCGIKEYNNLQLKRNKTTSKTYMRKLKSDFGGDCIIYYLLPKVSNPFVCHYTSSLRRKRSGRRDERAKEKIRYWKMRKKQITVEKHKI